MLRYKAKYFLTVPRSEMGFQELMRKYNLSDERLERIFRMLRRSDLVALGRLWEQDKFSETQFMRAFEEAENYLNGHV
jgi:hypothetical protein